MRGPDLRQATELLSLHPSRLATHLRLADAAGCDCLCGGVFFLLISHSTRAPGGAVRSYTSSRPGVGSPSPLPFCYWSSRCRVYLGRFERLFEDHTVFGGVTYTDAHVMLPGLLVICVALVIGAGIAVAMRFRRRRCRWLVAAIVPAVLCYLVLQVFGWYVSSFIVKPNRTGARAALYRSQHQDDAAGLRSGPRIAARVSRGDERRGGRPGNTIRPRSRISVSGTGAPFRTRCGRYRRSAPTTTFPTSTLIAMKSTANFAR